MYTAPALQRTRVARFGVLVAGVLVIQSRPVGAESVADAVRQHLGDNLDKQPKKPPPRAPAKKPPARRPPPRDPLPGPAPTGPARAPEPEPVETGPKLPIRLIGPDLRIDPRLEVGYRGWVLQQYPSVSVKAQSYFTWAVDIKARFFKVVSLHRGYYESNGLFVPRPSGAGVAETVGEQIPRAAWFLGVVGVPITKAWEPVIRYETRVFQTTATPSAPVRIVPHDTPASTDLSTIVPTSRSLTVTSGFETLVLGLQYNIREDVSVVMEQKKPPPIPPFYFGVGFVQYRKPYQVTVGEATLDSILFDARFRGLGLALGFAVPSRPDSFILQGGGQVGLGEVRLLGDLTLNELLPKKDVSYAGVTPPEWLIGYVQGDLTVGYQYPLLRTAPTLLGSIAATGGGATFFFLKTQREKGEQVTTPPLNWDFLWGVRVGLTLPF